MNESIDLMYMYQIAFEATIQGKDLSLEQKEYFRDSKGIGPSIGGSHIEDTGLVLRVYQPEKDEAPEEEAEELARKLNEEDTNA